MTDNKDKKALNVPALRFPEFTGEWENITIREACSEFQSGKNIKAEMINDQGLYPVYGGNGLRGFTGSYNHDGDYILIGRQGALCGNVRKVTGKTYVTEHAIAVCASKEHETTFLQHLFQKMRLGQYSDQSAQPGLAVNKLLRLNINVPSKNEQGKIAKILSLIDERITTQNKIIDKLETLIKGIVEKTFVSSQYVTLQHYSPIITSGKDQNSGGNYPLYGSTGVIGSVLNPSYNKPIVLIARVGSIGNVQYVTAPCGISDNTLIIDAGEDNRFIYYYLNGYNFSHIISGTTQPLITASSVKKIEIPVIEKHRRKKIVSTLYAIEQKLRNEKYIAYLLSRQKYFLLSQMFI